MKNYLVVKANSDKTFYPSLSRNENATYLLTTLPLTGQEMTLWWPMRGPGSIIPSGAQGTRRFTFCFQYCCKYISSFNHPSVVLVADVFIFFRKIISSHQDNNVPGASSCCCCCSCLNCLAYSVAQSVVHNLWSQNLYIQYLGWTWEESSRTLGVLNHDVVG